jgi:acetolactate synthase regulatory subunit
VESRGKQLSSGDFVLGTAVHDFSVMRDGIRYELVEDSGLASAEAAVLKARAKLYSSLSEVETGSLTPLLPRLELRPTDIIEVKLDTSSIQRNFYISAIQTTFNVEEGNTETEFTIKSKETAQYTELGKFYDSDVVNPDETTQ